MHYITSNRKKSKFHDQKIEYYSKEHSADQDGYFDTRHVMVGVTVWEILGKRIFLIT